MLPVDPRFVPTIIRAEIGEAFRRIVCRDPEPWEVQFFYPELLNQRLDADGLMALLLRSPESWNKPREIWPLHYQGWN